MTEAITDDVNVNGIVYGKHYDIFTRGKGAKNPVSVAWRLVMRERYREADCTTMCALHDGVNISVYIIVGFLRPGHI